MFSRNFVLNEQSLAIIEQLGEHMPGGVGSVTTLVLCKHVIQAAEERLPGFPRL